MATRMDGCEPPESVLQAGGRRFESVCAHRRPRRSNCYPTRTPGWGLTCGVNPGPADACLSEDMVDELRKCIRTNLDCADICASTGRVLSRHTGYDANLTRSVLEACAAACKACGDECGRHAEMHEHCRVCAASCRRCEQASRDLILARLTVHVHSSSRAKTYAPCYGNDGASVRGDAGAGGCHRAGAGAVDRRGGGRGSRCAREGRVLAPDEGGACAAPACAGRGPGLGANPARWTRA